MKRHFVFGVLCLSMLASGLEAREVIQPIIPKSPATIKKNQMTSLAGSLDCFSISAKDVKPEALKYLSPTNLRSAGENFDVNEIFKDPAKAAAMNKCFDNFRDLSVAIKNSAAEFGNEQQYINQISLGTSALLLPKPTVKNGSRLNLQTAMSSGGSEIGTVGQGEFGFQLNRNVTRSNNIPVGAGGSTSPQPVLSSASSTQATAGSGGMTGSITSDVSNPATGSAAVVTTPAPWTDPGHTLDPATLDGEVVRIGANAPVSINASLISTENYIVTDSNGVKHSMIREIFKETNSVAVQNNEADIARKEREKTRLDRKIDDLREDMQLSDNQEQRVAQIQQQQAQDMSQMIMMLASQAKKMKAQLKVMMLSALLKLQQNRAQLEAVKMRGTMQGKYMDEKRQAQGEQDKLDDQIAELENKRTTVGNRYIIREHEDTASGTVTDGTSTAVTSSVVTSGSTGTVAAITTNNMGSALASNSGCRPTEGTNTGVGALANDTRQLLQYIGGTGVKSGSKYKGIGGIQAYRPL